MTFDKAIDLLEVEAEIVPAEIDPMGAKVYIDNKEVEWKEIANNYPDIQNAVKEVYQFINNSFPEQFKENQPSIKDLTFKANGEVTLRPEKPIDIKGKNYKQLKYTLKNKKAIDVINSTIQSTNADANLQGELGK